MADEGANEVVLKSSVSIDFLGFQKRLVECGRKDDGSYVNDKMCLKTEAKPPMKQACNTQPCAAE